MRFVFTSLLGGVAALTIASAAGAQPAPLPLVAASAPVPATAASRANPPRNRAITAAENAKEPGVQRPEERVIPQISVPLKGRNVSLDPAASAPAGNGAVNDVAARCLATHDPAEKAACERGLGAPVPAKPVR